ncbi:MAG: ABC transporter ATP-binding protein [Candidatus Marinimicrobia bacterium]|nr:ABC transporter ATP-binding protein [Candidatus Neomarinimicrobiota bacterium]
MENIIETNHLTKRFGKFMAIDDINLCVRKGEIYGFLGLNGAGKTTTIRMLTGMIRPTSGTAFLFGKKVTSADSNLWEKVGYLVEVPYAYPDLTVRENLEIFRRLHFIADTQIVDSIIEKLQLGQYRDRLAKNLSLGNSQRLGLAKALMHNPEILILDEPANGLDPAGIVEIRELLYDLALNKGVTVFISSHILGEISRFATRIGIIHEGKLLRESNLEELEQLRRRSLLVNMTDKDGARSFLKEKGFSVSMTEEGFLEVAGQDAINSPGAVNIMLVQAGFPPTMLKIEEEDLESYFFRVIGRNGGVQ